MPPQTQKNTRRSQHSQQDAAEETQTHDDENAVSSSGSEDSSENDQGGAKRSRVRLTEEEYEFIARDIMSKPPVSGYLKYQLPLKYAARCEEVRWQWIDPQTGKKVFKELIGGGKNSDLEYD